MLNIIDYAILAFFALSLLVGLYRGSVATALNLVAVGAALLSADGRVFQGCNIENASFGLTNCAERTAMFKAVSEGVTEFTDIAIVGSLDGKKNTLVTGPCGVCRQALYEFCGPRLRVLMAKSEDDYIETTLGDLLPYGFGPTNLEIEPGAD